MKLINKTSYHSGDIRKLCRAGIRAEGLDPDLYTVRVVYGREPNYVGGYGYLDRYSLCLKPPKGGMGPELVMDFARTLVHEIAHNRGLRHKDMLPILELDISWAEGMVVRTRTPKPPKPEVPLVEKRATRAAAKVDEIERKIKRLSSRLKVWQNKVRYYERKAAKSGRDKA